MNNRYYILRVCLFSLISFYYSVSNSQVGPVDLVDPFVDSHNSRWFYDVAGKHIDTVAATLPTEMVKAAQERGSKRDLNITMQELMKELKTDLHSGSQQEQ